MSVLLGQEEELSDWNGCDAIRKSVFLSLESEDDLLYDYGDDEERPCLHFKTITKSHESNILSMFLMIQ